jgi:nucleoside-diphosphate-sugar epimerase
MKILLIGGSGFLGAWVTRFLQNNQFQIRIFDTRNPDSEWHRLSGISMDDSEFVEGDISRKSEVEEAMKGCQGVINLAGLLTPQCSAEPIRGAEVNLIGSINVFEAALKHDLNMVAYTSSIGVYGPDHADFPEPTTHYGSYKLASEGVARAFYEEQGISSLGVRPFVVYGPGREIGGSAGPSIACRMAVQNQAYQIPFTGLSGFVYAGDVAAILCQAVMEEIKGAPVINMPGITASVEDFTQEIQRQMPDAVISAAGPPLPVYGKIPPNPSWPLSRNHEPTPLSTGSARTLEYDATGSLSMASSQKEKSHGRSNHKTTFQEPS